MGYIEMASLLNKLTEKLLQEADLFHEVKDRVWSLLCMLKRLRPFVMEVHREQSSKMEELMREFVELVHEADDAIDSYVTIKAIRRMENIYASEKDRDGDMKADELRSKIEGIRLRLQLWHKRCLTCRAPSSVIAHNDHMVVGLENEVTMMIERLMDKDPQPDVIPIVGPGGVGKTTLARRVYNHPTTVENFPCRAWIYAYNVHEFSITKLLQEIINQVSHSPPPTTDTAAVDQDNDHDGEEMILRDLANQIYKHLKTCDRYLLVFDDVWRTQFWDDINMIFPDNKNGGGGRIIFTTRYDEVASYAMPRRRPFYLQPPLNKEESWALFSERVASSSRDEANMESQSQSHSNQLEPDHHPWKEWVDECGGLPLAIVELAAEHQRFISSAAAVDKEEDDHWDKRFPKGIWELMYENLPHHLKPCLLYLGVLNSCCSNIFKELLIAEGFVEQPRTTKIRSEKTVADVEEEVENYAEKYLNELIDRNLVEVVSKRWDGGIKDIAISKRLQLMNFCRFKAREENFLEIAEFEIIPWEANRISVRGWYGKYFEFISQGNSPMKARSFLMLEDSNFPSERNFDGNDWSPLLQNTSLRVLDFGVEFNHTIPREIDRQIHLRYLRINYQGSITLPPSICNLWNLQFLRLKNNNPRSEIPLERFWRMRQLRHLLCSDELRLSQPPDDGNDRRLVFYNLRSLKYVSAYCCTKNLLSSMPNLVRLAVGGDIKQTHIDEISNSLPLLKHLQKLVLRGGEAMRNDTISLLRWDDFRPNITCLSFKRTRLVGDPMRILGKLPNLQVLKLAFNAVDGDVLDIGVTTDDGDVWFRQLKCLKLEQLKIRRWNLSVGAMPGLEILVIRNCTSLQGLPSEALQEIQSLQQMEIHHYVDPAVETAAVAIQECVGKDHLQLRLMKKPDDLNVGQRVN
ncbi:probable disease resistance RPP8-like protein 4 [Macadamia integrifolia]|uniref:probable disease resistance RPP8-like protein 4 n=1 Tax=Macadamia integrifolia TaxID=60698 RepID=UPI001C4FCB9C|nr:probable disease resistance RPP8-like protein 4 [Macadamia integrifolia]XP_042485897.1 probable disease resistance RPP8-like protein 4 [Macadamia integrifolia]XP_042485898.1 probable disease resistance RPP8-like protein 4 [Macadamia integrifolia]